MSKTFLIRDIPEKDWKKFKRWTAIEGYNNLNHAVTTLVKLAANNKIYVRPVEAPEGSQ